MLEKPIIFFDTEFTDLNPYTGEILSIGMVKEAGEEFYVELECEAPCSEWVKANILPTLTGKKVPRKEAKRMIAEFIGKDEPVMMANVNQYDVLYFYKLYEGPETPFFWIPVDFASILYERGYEPEDYGNRGKMLNALGIDIDLYNQHNALDDAKLVRETYMRLKAIKREID